MDGGCDQITILTTCIWTNRPEQNSLDQDQTIQNASSAQGLHCLSSCNSDTFTDNKMNLLKFLKYKIESKVSKFL